MASAGQKVGSFFFAAFLVGAIVADWLCCIILEGLKTVGLLSNPTKEGLALMCTKFTWACAVKSAFWIRTSDAETMTPGAWDAFLADMDAQDAAVAAGGTRQPIFIMSNHVSFFDTLTIVVYTPPRVLWRIRCYMGSFLFKLPLFSTICKVLGHFPVYFLKAEDGKFTLNQEKMVPVEEKVSAHLARGGILSLFPEGAMNTAPNPSSLNTFRYGTFKRALKEDARIWNFVTYGHHEVWPVKASVGGQPGRTGMALHPVTPKGARAALKELVKQHGGKSVETQSSDDFVVLAEHCKVTMQQQYDQLASAIDAKAGKAKSA